MNVSADEGSVDRKESPAGLFPEQGSTTSLYAEISREMVRLYKEQFGRGPVKARTKFAGPDCLVCTLEESLTKAERGLVTMGEEQRLRDTRSFSQYATEMKFLEVIERLSGRRVRAFVSGIDVSHDVSAEVFYLGETR
jgi:uncharacterized protein YbcI